MYLNIAGVEVVDSVINTEFRLAVLERVVDRLLQAAPPGVLTPQDIQTIRNQVLEDIKRKYPNAGISAK